MAALLHASRVPQSNYEVVLVASNNNEAGGLKLAEAECIPIFALSHKGMDRDAHDSAMEQAAIEAGAEYIALAGYMRILGSDFVQRWKDKIINIHPSLLPKYKGLHTHQRAIDAGDAHGGASVHIVTPELDDGEVLAQAKVAIWPDDTPDSLAARVLVAEHQIYSRALNEYVGRGQNSDWLLAQIRQRALSLPETEERESHGAPGWRTGGKSGKFFAYFSDKHHGEPHIALLVKTSGVDEMCELIECDPDTFYRPAYYGASGWVGIVLNQRGLDWSQITYWLERSWRQIAPKRLTKPQDAAAEF